MTQFSFMKAFAFLTAVASVASIYNDDHWDHATRVTDLDHFNELIQTAVSGEQHLIVRWIASEG